MQSCNSVLGYKPVSKALEILQRVPFNPLFENERNVKVLTSTVLIRETAKRCMVTVEELQTSTAQVGGSSDKATVSYVLQR